jgi:catechol 2,3-dioxygenase-like lactoylglutathione lyase family enzyme
MPIHALGLRTVIYPAPDLAASTEWWATQLGFGPYFNEPFYVGFNVGGYELGLLPDLDPADGPITYWGVSDIDASIYSAVEAGATVHAPATDVGDGILTASVRTPMGPIVGFIVNPHFTPGA